MTGIQLFLSYIVEFGIYLKENGKLLKDAM